MELRKARFRDPPSSWFLAAKYKYETPEWAERRRDGKAPQAAFDKAVENSLRMLEMMESGMSLPGIGLSG